MTVVYIEPGKVLRMEGGLGPFQLMAVSGSLTFTISTQKDHSRIGVRYTAGGYIPGGAGKYAILFDQVLGEQFRRLAAYAAGKK